MATAAEAAPELEKSKDEEQASIPRGMDKAFLRILVTGGAGFLGSNLCRRLVNEGHDVICVDNYFTGSKHNVADLLGRTNFELLRHDVTEPLMVEVDQIYNMACPASPPHYQFNPVKTIKTSFLGTYNQLGLAKRCHARILQASTSECYGDPEVSPQKETYWGHVNPIGVRSCYDEGKRVAETLVFEYRRQGVDTRCARIFNTYGPGMHPYDGRVVSNFIMQALEGKDLTVYGEGEQTRSFCFVEDEIEGLVRMMNNSSGHPGPVNIGNENEFTIMQLAELCIELTGSKSKIVKMPLPCDDPKQRRPDCTLAREVLDGWEPTIQLREGLQKTIAYFSSLDLKKFRKPTPQTAHQSSQSFGSNGNGTH